jgi:nucleoside-diphosphate-sugar epimerase
LEQAVGRELTAFVYASSSSVYGDQKVYPACGDAPVAPLSPYGATKVITEQLANAFWRSAGVPVVGLRYFTVYGPRQRPDMAFSRFIARALSDRPLAVQGDGRQVREFTYFADIVNATIAAVDRDERGSVYNVRGGEAVALIDVAGPGDPRRTEADVGRAARDLGYQPDTSLSEGLAAQIAAVAARPLAIAEAV